MLYTLIEHQVVVPVVIGPFEEKDISTTPGFEPMRDSSLRSE